MNRLTILISIIILQGCVPDMTPQKNIIKHLKSGTAEIEWYSRSAAYVDVPDLVVITEGKVSDTICRASNIADLKITNNDTIVIGFYGKPRRSMNSIELPKMMMGFNIVADTTYHIKVQPH